MLFRIENTENVDGHYRQYAIPFENLPKLKGFELESYLAEQIRKEVNNAKDRSLLSYSKALGVCLLKYNKYVDNEIHINRNYWCGYVEFDISANQNKIHQVIPFDLLYGIENFISAYRTNNIVLQNFQIDISNNQLLDGYLRRMIGVGKKIVASPEKDKEVLLMQSPDDIIISAYSDAVYLLYALFWKYGIDEYIFNNLWEQIRLLPLSRFECCGESERYGLLLILEYLYYYGAYERQMSQVILEHSSKAGHISAYFDPILQFYDIQENSLEDAYMLSDYNRNIVSDLIWKRYVIYFACR